MDQWILSFTNSRVASVATEMSRYHLFAVVPPLVSYFDTLTNWYVRMNRKRIKVSPSLTQWYMMMNIGRCGRN